MDLINWRGGFTRLGIAAACMIGAATATAAPVITVEIIGPEGGIYDTYELSAEGTPNSDGTFGLAGVGYGTSFQCDWNIEVNPDPSITGSFTLTNLSGTTQNFIMNVSLPVPGGLSAPTVMGGFVGSLANGVQFFDDNNSSLVTVASVGTTPIYQAQLDNGTVTVQSLLGSSSFTALGGPGAYGDFSQLLWGAPIPSAPGPGFATNMRVRTTLSLTAGDRVIIPVNFVIEHHAVPEPSSFVLIGLGLAAIAGLRARRA